MKAVLTILIAELRRNKLQTLVFSAGCFLCTFLMLGALILHFSIEPSFDSAYQRLNAPNVQLSIAETAVTEEELQGFMGALTYVESYTISKRYLASNVTTPYETMEFVYLATTETAGSSDTRVLANRGTHCVEGDEVELSINGNTVAFQVDSIIIDAVNSAPEAMIPCFWLEEEALEEVTKGYTKGSWLLSARINQHTAKEFVSEYEQFFGHVFDGEIISYEDIKHAYTFRYEIFSEFFLFLFLFLFIMILAMTVLFAKMAVKAQLQRMGILRAIGFTERNIKAVYILRYVLVAMWAGVMGVLVSGIVLEVWLGGMFQNIDRKLFHIDGLIYYELLVFFVFNLIVYFCVSLAIYKWVRVSPMAAINKEASVVRGRLTDVFMSVPRFMPLNLGLIKCMHRRLESVFILVLTLGMGVLFLTSVYILHSAGSVHSHLADWGIVEMDVYIARKTNVDEEECGLLKALDSDGAVAFYYAGLSDNITYRLSGSNMTYNVVGEVYDKEIPKGLAYKFLEGRNPLNTEEAAIGISFARHNQVGIGDSIYVIRNGKETELSIVGIYPSFKQYGDSIRMITEDIKEFFGNTATGYYSVVLAKGQDVMEFAERMGEAYPDFNFFPMERSNMHAVKMLLPPIAMCMLLFALLFIMIIRCMKSLMLMECKNDFDTYHFIGFSVSKMKAVLQWRFHIPVLVGMLMAIPVSVYVMPVWMQPIAQSIGLAQIPVYPNVLLVAIGLLSVFICGRLCPNVRRLF